MTVIILLPWSGQLKPNCENILIIYKKHKLTSSIALAILLGLVSGCGSSDNAVVTGPEAPQEISEDDPEQPATSDPTGIISTVSIGATEGLFFRGQPAESIGSIVLSPLTNSDTPTQFISGGSTQLPIESDTAFSTVYIVSDDEGYFQVNLPEQTTATNVVVTYSALQLDGEEATIGVQVQSPTGAISEVQSLAVSSLIVGTGDLQVSVSWDTPTDVDLYLYEPNGDEISFLTDGSAAGGSLDLDSNVLCFIDGINNENITYENVTPPTGEYTVELDYYSACDVTGPTNYVVTIRIDDQVRTIQGTFTPEDDNGENTPITTFEVR